MKNRIQVCVVIIATLVLLLGFVESAVGGVFTESRGVAPVEPETPSWEAFTSKKWAISTLVQLAKCESGLNPNAIHRNDGGSDSRGLLQFKLKTFVGYALKYSLFPEAEAHELENLWTDPDAQIKVAAKMIKEPRGYYHWKNCATKLGYIVE